MTTILETLIKYFRSTHPLRMVFHLVWLTTVLCVISLTYIMTFHFQPAIEVWQHSKNMQNFAAELRTSVAVDADATDELSMLLKKTQANRSYVFRFHNGIPASTNVPFIFNTNTHEVISPGTSRVIHISQRLPSSLNFGMNVKFIHNECVTLNHINVDPNHYNYWYYQTRNATAMMRCPFFSHGGDLIGYVGVDYVNDEKQDMYLDAHMDDVKSSADRLGKIFDR